MTQVIQDLQWRYATKQYDTEKKISQSDLDTLFEGLQLSASSYGLQPYRIVHIRDEALQLKLREASWGQPCISDSSDLIVFAAQKSITESDIDQHLANTASIRGLTAETLEGYGQFMKSKVLPMDPSDQLVWNSKQTYIALGNLLNLAASLKIDSTPVEGFDPDQYDEILQLPQRGLRASVVCALGYRSEADATAGAPKVRKSLEDLIINI